MQVEEQEFKTGILTFEVSPTANTRQYGIPTFTRYVGSLRKPEVPLFYNIEFVGTIENSGMFSFLFTVITPYADVIISG